MAENTSLVEQALKWAGAIEEGVGVGVYIVGGPADCATPVLRQLADRVQEQQRTIGSLNACIGGPGSLTTDNLTLVGRLEARVQELEWKSQPSSVQPEKERGPITAQQVLAAAACHERGRVVISTVQRTLRIGYREADELCRSIIAAGLVDGLEISPALLPVSPPPSMVGREGEQG